MISSKRFDIVGQPSINKTDFQTQVPGGNLQLSGNVLFNVVNNSNDATLGSIFSELPKPLEGLVASVDNIITAILEMMNITLDALGTVLTTVTEFVNDLLSYFDSKLARLGAFAVPASFLCDLSDLTSIDGYGILIGLTLSFMYSACLNPSFEAILNNITDATIKKIVVMVSLSEAIDTENTSFTLDIINHEEAKDIELLLPTIVSNINSSFNLSSVYNTSVIVNHNTQVLASYDSIDNQAVPMPLWVLSPDAPRADEPNEDNPSYGVTGSDTFLPTLQELWESYLSGIKNITGGGDGVPVSHVTNIYNADLVKVSMANMYNTYYNTGSTENDEQIIINNVINNPTVLQQVPMTININTWFIINNLTSVTLPALSVVEDTPFTPTVTDSTDDDIEINEVISAETVSVTTGIVTKTTTDTTTVLDEYGDEVNPSKNSNDTSLSANAYIDTSQRCDVFAC